MPINRYFGGHGSEVMSNMKKQYGEDKGEGVFYATANKRGQNPGSDPEEQPQEPRKPKKFSFVPKMKKKAGYTAEERIA